MSAAPLDPIVEGYLEYLADVRRQQPRTVVDVRCTLRQVSAAMARRHPGVALWQLRLAEALRLYRRFRGAVRPTAPFFQSRRQRGLSRGAVYERVRTWAQQAGLPKRVTPHVLRHTFATHLVKAGVALVTIRDLLGHRLITSTQVYLHVTAADLRDAAQRHPIGQLAESLAELLPQVKLPFQLPPGRRRTG